MRYPSDDLAAAVLGPVEVEIFENLYAAYADDARRAAYGLLHDRELAADAAHTAFVELLRAILAGRRWYEPAEARAAVLRNTAWAALKALRTRRRRPESPMPLEPAGQDVTWARVEARALCEQVVGRLRGSQQEALRLYFVEGLSYVQAAAHLEISEAAFDARLSRAIRAARRTAHSLGMRGLLVAGACRRLRSRAKAPRREAPAGAPPMRASLAAGVTAAALVSGMALAAGLAGTAVRQASITVSASTVARDAEAAPPGTRLDTVPDSAIVDVARAAPGTVVLLGQGRHCACGLVFLSDDNGRTWSAKPGPARVSGADRLVVSLRSGALQIVVLRANGSTFSLPSPG
jgi:RNA polymerase sigma factor (sigma-70 family)